MVKNFTILPHQERVNKPWGHEIILNSPDAPMTSKIIYLNAGARFSLQYHDRKEEILTIVSGEAVIYLEDESGNLREIKMELHKGYQIKPMQKHRVKGITDAQILESSTKETGNTFRLEDDYSRGTETEESRASRTQQDVYMG